MSYKNPPKGKEAIPFKPAEITRRFSNAKNRKDNWVTLYRDAMEYVTPQRETFYQYSPGEKKGRTLYDNTAQEAIEIFQSRIMSTITPSWQRWSEFRAGSSIPEDSRDAINKKLIEVNNTVFDYINHSNFTAQASECYLDLGYGTCAMLFERGEGEDLFEFTSTPLSELFLEEGPDGSVQTNYRLISSTAQNLIQRFPKAVWSEAITKSAEKQSDATFKVIMGSVYHPKQQQWWQIVMEDGADTFAQYHVESSNPWIIPRWAVNTGEVYGRGPAIKMLPTIKTLNKMTEFMLRHAAMAVSGAYTAVSDGIVNPYTIKIQPNAIIPVKAADSLQPLAMAGNPDFSNFVRAELREEVKQAFLASPMPSFNDPVRTATEISIRNSEMLKNSGAQLGRLKSEWVEPIIARAVAILREEGLVPDIKIDGKEVTIKHTSPLAKIEDQEDLQGLSSYFSFMGQAEVYSPGLTALSTKLEELPAWLALKIGGFEQLIRSKEEAKQLGQTVLDTGQAMAEAEQGVEQAGMAGEEGMA